MKKILKPAASLFLAGLIMVTMFCVTAFAATDIYTVQKGDSLWIIASKYRVGLSEIILANPQFENPHLIYPGDKVAVPLDNPVLKSIEEQVVALVNLKRLEHNLKPLNINWELARTARYKSNDMRDKGYFSHTSPTYGSPFDMLTKFGISYKSAGENIAKGQQTAQAVFDAWMSSEGHRNNILNPAFTEIGVGYAIGNNTTFWTQLFIKN